MNLQDLSHRIRGQREKRGLKQHDIAHALQVSPQAISKWERGENAPELSLLLPLGRLLGVSVDWLLGAYSEDPDVMEATVFASGVRIARNRSEELTPRQFADWIGSYCFQATESVLQYDGIPIKNIGPGILSFFSGTNHAGRAVEAATHLCTITADDQKIGLSSGQIYFGSIGHPDYAQSDVIGEPVSLALLAMDWIGEHSGGSVVLTESVIGSLAPETQSELTVGPAEVARLPGITKDVSLVKLNIDDSHSKSND